MAKLSSAMYQFVLVCAALVLLSACEPVEEPLNENFEIRLVPLQERSDDGENIRKGDRFEIAVYSLETGLKDSSAALSNDSQSFESDEYSWSLSSTDQATLEVEEGYDNIITLVDAGEITVVAENSQNKTEITFTVLPALLQSISISSDETSLILGTTSQLTVTGSFSDDSQSIISEGISWSVAEAEVASVNNQGVLQSLNQGESLVTALVSNTNNAELSSNVTYTITPAAIAEVNLSGLATLPIGRATEILASATFTDGTELDVSETISWALDSDEVVSINDSGQVQSLILGNVSISATIDNGYGDLITSNVHDLAVTEKVIDSLRLTPVNSQIKTDPLTVPVEKSEVFTLDAIYSNAEEENVSARDGVNITSSDESIATIVFNQLDENFTITTLALGTSQLTSSLINSIDETIELNETLTVNKPLLVEIEIQATSALYALGLVSTWQATGVFEDGTRDDISSSVIWSTSNSSIAEFNTDNANELTALSLGSTQISASLINDESTNITSNVVDIETKDALLTEVKINIPDENLWLNDVFNVPQGYSTSINVIGVYTNGEEIEESDATWSLTGNDLITVSGTNGYVVTGNTDENGTGELVLNVSVTRDEGVFTSQVNVNVVAPKITSLAISLPEENGLWKGYSQSYIATAVFSDSSTLDVTSNVEWLISDDSTSVIEFAGNNNVSLLLQGQASLIANYTDASYNNQVTSANYSFDIAGALLESIAIQGYLDTDKNGTGDETLNDLAKGQYATFTATGSYSDQSTADLTTSVSWQSSNTSVLTIEQGDDDAGQARAIESSEVQISVTAEVDNAAGTSISSSYALTVIPAVLESINLEPEAFSYGTNVPSGESVQLTVWGIYSDGSYQQIEDENAATWVSSNSDVAVVEGTTGLVDMVAGDNNIVSITATEVISGNSYTDSLLLNRIDPAFKTIRIAPDTSTDPWNVALGSQYQMQAFAVYSDGSEQEITAADGTSWQLVEQSQQTIATINNSDIKGLVTGLLESDTVVDLQVDAENRFDVQISATASVIVGAPVLELIELSPNNSTMIAGDVLTFTATGYTSDDKFLELSDTVTWSTDDTSVAEFNQSNAYDLKSKQAGNIEVIASYVPPGQEEISTTTRVTVEAAVLREIELTQTIERFTVSPAPKPLFLTGVQDLLTATGIYSDETTERVNGQVDWSSSNSAVATIDSIGLLTPIKPGEATITASLLVTELGQVRTVYIDYEIEVGEALLEYIELSPLSPATTLGLPLEFSATGFYSDGTSEDLTDTATWRVGRVGDDPASLIGGITSGTNIGGIFTATENGFTPISAEIDDYDGQSVSKQTFVTVSDISSIAVTTNEVNFFAGQSADFIATGMTESGDEVTFTQGLDWQISGAGGALVDAGEASSNASIQSSASGSMDIDVTWTKPDTTTVTGSLTVNVGSELLSSLAITSPQTEVANGRDLQLVATGTYSNSVTTNVSSTVTWVSSDESVVTIDSDGLLSTVASGESTITASITNAAGTLLDSNELEITVISPVLDSIALSLGNTSLPKGESVRLVATGTMTDGTNELPTPVTWTSSDTSVATVDNGGTVLMLNTASVGETATITASALESLTSSNPAITESIVVTAATPILSSLAIDSVGGEIARGTSTTLTASGLLSDNTSGLPTTLSWSSNSSQMTIDASTGVVTVPDGATIGSLVTITVTAPEETGSSEMVSNSTIIAVGAPLVDSLSISNGSISVPRGTTQQLTAAVVMSDSSSTPVLTWSSSDTNLASVSSSGLVSIPNGATVGGIATITVQVNKSANSSEIIQDSIFVTVTPATLSALAIDSANGDVPKGTSLSLSVTGTLSDNGSGVPTTVTWTSSDTAVATVTQSGVVTVLNSATVTNTTTITASAESETGSGVNRTATFVVTADDPILSSLSIDQADMTLGFGQTVNLSVTGNLSDSTNGLPTTVTWTSSNDDIATVDAAGLVTVSNSTSIGSQVVITASAPIATGSATTVVDSLAITISQAVLESITLSSTNTSAGVTSISVGTDHQIDVTAVLSNGTSDILTAQTWTSSNIAVATVDNNGLVSVLAGATPAATTIITLSAPEVDGSGTNITGTIEITAGGAVINSIAIDSFNQTVARGTELTLSATATLSDGTTDPAPSSLSWTSLNLANATIVEATGVMSIPDTATVGSTVTVKVSTPIESGSAVLVENDILVTVGQADLESLAISPGSVSAAVGSTVQLSVTGTLTDGGAGIPTSVSWEPVAGDVTVDNNGLVTIANGAGVGTVTITAKALKNASSADFISDSITLTVTGAEVTSIAIDNSNVSVPRGATLALTALGTQSDGSNGDNGLTWSCDESPSCNVSIDSSTGVVTADQGVAITSQATIRVATPITSGSGTVVEDTLVVTITNPNLTGLTITEGDSTVVAGDQLQLNVSGTFSDSSSSSFTPTWSSDNANVVVDSSTGLVSVSTTGLDGETATITVSADTSDIDNTQITDTIEITIDRPLITSVSFDQATQSVAVGTSITIVATLNLDDTSTVIGAAITDDITWSIVNESVPAEPDAVITETNEGTVTVTIDPSTTTTTTFDIQASVANRAFSSSNVTQSITVTVGSPVVVVNLTSSEGASLPLGKTSTISYAVVLSDGNAYGGSVSDANFTWSKTDQSLDLVSLTDTATDATVQAIRLDDTTNTVTITADFDNSSDTASADIQLTVANPEIESLEIHAYGDNALVENQEMTLTPIAVYSDKSTAVYPNVLDWSGTGLDFNGSANSLTNNSGNVEINSSGDADTISANNDVTITVTDDTVTPNETATYTLKVLNVGTAVENITPIEIQNSDFTVQAVQSSEYQLRNYLLLSTNQVLDISTYTSLWTASDSSETTVDSSGLITFGSSAADGTVTANDGTRSSVTNVSVETGTLELLEVYPRDPIVRRGKTFSPKAYGVYTYNGGADRIVMDVTNEVVWTSSSTSKLSNSGLAEATASAADNLTYTATIGGISDDVSVIIVDNVDPSPGYYLNNITIEAPTNIHDLGATATTFARRYQLTAKANYTDGSNTFAEDITEQVYWHVTESSFASISNAAEEKGLLTPVVPVATHDSTLNVNADWYTDTGLVTATQSINLQQGATDNVTSIAIGYSDPTASSITSGNFDLGKEVNAHLTLTATIDDADGASYEAILTEQTTWTADVRSEVEVSNAPNQRGRITSLSTDFAADGDPTNTITANIAGTSITAATYEIERTNGTLTGLTVAPDTPTIAVGDSQQFTAVGAFSSGDDIDMSLDVVWISSDPAKLFISNAPETKGQATRLATGNVTVTASYKAVSDTSGTIN